MDDISRIQKVNSLARELMKHGQASSMEQAIRLAMQQVESGASDFMSNIQSCQIPEPPSPGGFICSQDVFSAAASSAAAFPAVDQPVTAPASSAEFDNFHALHNLVSKQQNVVGSMANAVNYQAKQISDINNKINILITEISALKEEIKKLKDSPVTPPLKQKDAKEGQTQFKQEIPTPPSPPHGQQPMSGHVRSGNYKPDDVSIEKFFYFGNR